MDNKVTLQQLKDNVDAFIAEREWHQFHNPKNLSMNLVSEATELLEKFLWVTGEGSHALLEKDREDIEDEAADVLFGLLAFCNASNIDISSAFLAKIQKVAQKYPVEKARGRYEKYTKL